MTDHLIAVRAARAEMRVLAIESARRATQSGITGADHSTVLIKLRELSDVAETFVEAFNSTANHSFVDRDPIDKTCTATAVRLQKIGSHIDAANKALCRQIATARTGAAENEKRMFVGNPVRIAVGEACTGLYGAADAMGLIKYLIPHQFREVIDLMAGMWDDLAKAIGNENVAAVAACHRCRPDSTATARNATKVAEHLNSAALLAGEAQRLAVKASATPVVHAPGRATHTLGSTA